MKNKTSYFIKNILIIIYKHYNTLISAMRTKHVIVITIA